ncbi:UNVERIFIED_CONTAM: hypothetical protein Sradi_6839500 [Sesamum radiatum]|uniref:Uncharacterized protein n=1 Tax=Sesamum radiatum TaxID=300843 RepID=A0AAW2JP18_SESRA
MAADIMFSKYLRDYAVGEHGGGTPPPHSPRGTPTSSGTKGKRPVSPLPGVMSKCPAKRTRENSLGTPPTGSSRPSSSSPSPPALNEERGFPSKPSRVSSGNLHSLQSFKQDEELSSSLALTLMGDSDPRRQVFLGSHA